MESACEDSIVRYFKKHVYHQRDEPSVREYIKKHQEDYAKDPFQWLVNYDASLRYEDGSKNEEMIVPDDIAFLVFLQHSGYNQSDVFKESCKKVQLDAIHERFPKKDISFMDRVLALSEIRISLIHKEEPIAWVQIKHDHDYVYITNVSDAKKDHIVLLTEYLIERYPLRVRLEGDPNHPWLSTLTELHFTNVIKTTYAIQNTKHVPIPNRRPLNESDYGDY
jgi:hypothetical protein